MAAGASLQWLEAMPNGQTVAIGGMMQDQNTVTDSKIPLLGDIPGIGLLFHHKVKAINKTELMIFLTPYVIRTPEDFSTVLAMRRALIVEAPQRVLAAVE